MHESTRSWLLSITALEEKRATSSLAEDRLILDKDIREIAGIIEEQNPGFAVSWNDSYKRYSLVPLTYEEETEEKGTSHP